MVILVISSVFFLSKKIILPIIFPIYLKTDKYTKMSKLTPLELPKTFKIHHEYKKYPKTL